MDNVVRLDNWINLEMDPNDAATIAALRVVIQDLIVSASENPGKLNLKKFNYFYFNYSDSR